MQITTYQSSTAWPDKRWLAHMDITGKGNLFMSFFGKTEAEATEKANAWWQAEVARQQKLEANVADVSADDYKPSTGRGAHFIGKVWMIHQHTREKIRINESEQALYEGRGYVKGGPRSK